MNHLPFIYAILASWSFHKNVWKHLFQLCTTPPDYTNELSILTNKGRKNLGGNPQFIYINPNWHLDKAPKLIRKLSSLKLEVQFLTLSQSWASQCGGHSFSPQGWMASGLFSSEHWDSGTTRPSGVLQYTCRTIFPCPHGPEHWISFTKSRQQYSVCLCWWTVLLNQTNWAILLKTS